jgi:hypothetical protein
MQAQIRKGKKKKQAPWRHIFVKALNPKDFILKLIAEKASIYEQLKKRVRQTLKSTSEITY